MANYRVSNTQAGSQQSLTNSYKSIVILTAATATLRRAWIENVIVGADGAPSNTDGPLTFQFSRQTAAGTATSATPNLLDPADGVAGTVAAVNATAEGTVTAASEVLTITINQRNTQNWMARDDRARLVIPAVNLNGIAGRAKSPVTSSYSSTVTMDVEFAE